MTGFELNRLKNDLAALLSGASKGALVFPKAAEANANPPQPTILATPHQTRPSGRLSAILRPLTQGPRYQDPKSPTMSLEPQDLPGEMWRSIPEAPRNEVSNLGRVRSLGFTTVDGRRRAPKIMAKNKDTNKVTLSREGQPIKTVSVHKIVEQVWADGALPTAR